MSKKHDIIWLDSIDSTNEEAKRHISDIDNLSVLSAYEQTEGRGQRGNTWTSTPGENLMFSVVLKFSPEDSGLGGLDARDQFVLNEIAALSVVDFLRLHDIQAQIKWPNDVYVDSRKMCGILIENSIRGNWLSSSIIGIGLNINQRNFDVNLPNPTSMALCQTDLSCHSDSSQCHSERSDESFDIRTCLEEFMDIFTSYYNRYLAAGGDFSSLRQQYLENLWRLDIQAEYIDYTSLPSGCHEGPMNISSSCSPGFPGQTAPAGRPFTGIIRGLSPIGLLIVEEMEKGELKEFAFKEIGYIL